MSCSYGDHVAFQNVDLDVAKGQITALIGPSGCGKTSLLSCVNRLTDLIPGCRVAGRIDLGDLDVLSASLDTVALRRRVGMIFQKPNPFPLSIRRNLELPLREHGMKSKARRAETITRVLRDVGLWDEVRDRLDELATGLSGGQKQRLCIARALALEPEIILFDEPCSALDPISSGVVEDLIAGLRGKYTVVIVTHNLAQARRIADRVAFFWVRNGVGRLVEQGTAQQIFEQPGDELTRAYVAGMRG
ncbi:MAG: phosphate ABC transporter ATP-binding protein [Thermoanaerobaculia bacterium]|nr:phosphate ABC transporter ATP-binding protein [Thermoanaerobaculia bacterium]